MRLGRVILVQRSSRGKGMWCFQALHEHRLDEPEACAGKPINISGYLSCDSILNDSYHSQPAFSRKQVLLNS